VHASWDSGDSTYNVYGTDSESATFCCSVAATSVTFLIVNGGAGPDTMNASYTTHTLCGIGGGQGLTATFSGGPGVDSIIGSPAIGCTTLWETIYGGSGVDGLAAYGRTVTIYGEDGDDALFDWGDSTDTDTLNATLHGGPGGDGLYSENDLGTVMYGGDDDDTLWGWDGPDEMHGGNGADGMSGGEGGDQMWGDAGDDIVAGDGGTDQVYGGFDQDTVCGGGGSGDEMSGGGGDDVLDDDGTGGTSNGNLGTNTCDSITTRTNCATSTTLTYQCDAY